MRLDIKTVLAVLGVFGALAGTWTLNNHRLTSLEARVERLDNSVRGIDATLARFGEILPRIERALSNIQNGR